MRQAQIRQILVLIALTVVYLSFELGFNARLLDVVGSRATPHDIEELEFFGRTLSGIAAALVVLHVLWTRRLRTGGQPSFLMIAVACAVTALLVFSAIKLLVNVLVDTRDADFRRVATNAGLLQRSLVQGDLHLDGLVDDGVYARPEGKAFLAVFQVLLSNIDNLDEKVEPKKRQVIRSDLQRQMKTFSFDGRDVRMTAPGIRGYHQVYTSVMQSVADRWKKYAGVPVASDIGLAREQDRAWLDYRNSLSRRGWTPERVPARYQGRVTQDVRKRIPVPADWQPHDRDTFNEAVAQQYWKTMRSRTVHVEGDAIPPGLSYEDFVARPGVQKLLRQTLMVPASMSVAANYTDPASFKRLYDGMLDRAVDEALPRFSANAVDFQRGGQHQKLGEDAARAAIVPPVALLCSLLGAVGHFAKLLYLIAKLIVWLRTPAGQQPGRTATRAAGLALVLTLVCVWTAFSFMQNNVTQSELFQQMSRAELGRDDESLGQALRRRVLANVAHVVVVGQAYTYPFNEAVRTRVLGGIKYGYHGDAS
ncbi:hypothetical protein [Achromobacter piechaudii]|uniref:Uncharacterized protein n=1 Tax=Achromobacter piechaudii ATCC 43553 TaxID=742159 RepID=D4X433_9BURK|nr:hypothetical protein [Achromobacter piechaudii]EFF78440.1 hypothetical protein HMPREF0004_0230 [Achromobacter piechaudii ATCC 43553]